MPSHNKASYKQGAAREPHLCDLCGLVCSNRYNLLVHRERKHGLFRQSTPMTQLNSPALPPLRHRPDPQPSSTSSRPSSSLGPLHPKKPQIAAAVPNGQKQLPSPLGPQSDAATERLQQPQDLQSVNTRRPAPPTGTSPHPVPMRLQTGPPSPELLQPKPSTQPISQAHQSPLQAQSPARGRIKPQQSQSSSRTSAQQIEPQPPVWSTSSPSLDCYVHTDSLIQRTSNFNDSPEINNLDVVDTLVESFATSPYVKEAMTGEGNDMNVNSGRERPISTCNISMTTCVAYENPSVQDVMNFLRLSEPATKKLLDICVCKNFSSSLLTFSRPDNFILTIPMKLWTQGFDHVSAKEEWGEVIDIALEEIGFPCSFNAKRAYTSKLDPTSFTLTGHCAGNCTTKFTMKAKMMEDSTAVKVEVKTTGEFQLLQTKPTGRQIRGSRRTLGKAELDYLKPYKLFLRREVGIQELRLLHNCHRQKSLYVIQKMSGEAKGKQPHGGELMNALQQLKVEFQNNKHYQSHNDAVDSGAIRSVWHTPFGVSMYTPLQLKYFTLCDAVFLDSSGHFVKNVDGKKCLNHALMARQTEAPAVGAAPVHEFILNKNDTESVKSMLGEFVANANRLCKTANPKIACCDFSFVNIHALLDVFNAEDIVTAMNNGFVRTRDNGNPDPKKTDVILCKLHVLKAFQRNLTRKNVASPLRHQVLHGFVKLQEAETFNIFEDNLYKFLTLFGCKRAPLSVIQKLSYDLTHDNIQRPLEEDLERWVMVLKEPDEELDDSESSEERLDQRTQREKSLFYQYFKTKLSSVESFNKSAEDDSYSDNPFHCPEAVAVLGDTYIPYATFWLRCVPRHPIPDEFCETGLLTNADIESYFGVLKTKLHTNSFENVVSFLRDHIPLAQSIVNRRLKSMLDEILGSGVIDNREHRTVTAMLKVAGDQSPYDIEFDDEKKTLKDDESKVHAKETWQRKPTKKKVRYQNRHQRLFFSPMRINHLSSVSDVTDYYTRVNQLVPKIRKRLNKVTCKDVATTEKLKVAKRRVGGINRTKTSSKANKFPKTESNSSVPGDASDSKTSVSFTASTPVPCVENYNCFPDMNETVVLNDEEQLKEVFVREVVTEEVLPLVFRTTGVTGNEEDVACLAGQQFLNDSVMHALAEMMVNSYGKMSSEGAKLDHVVSSFLVIGELQHTKSTAEPWYEWHRNPIMLPHLDLDTLCGSRLFLMCNLQQHWWYMVAQFDNLTLTTYDSKRGYIPFDIRTEMLNQITGALHEKYNIDPQAWTPLDGETPQQINGFSCGELSIVSLESVLKGTNPMVVVNPSNWRGIRNHFARTLLATGRNGKALFNNFVGHSCLEVDKVEVILWKLSQRMTIRQARRDWLLWESRLKDIERGRGSGKWDTNQCLQNMEVFRLSFDRRRSSGALICPNLGDLYTVLRNQRSHDDTLTSTTAAVEELLDL